MTVTDFKDCVAAIPDDDHHAPIIVIKDGNLLGVEGISVEDGSVVIRASAVIVTGARGR